MKVKSLKGNHNLQHQLAVLDVPELEELELEEELAQCEAADGRGDAGAARG